MNLMLLPSSKNELQWLEYLELVFLEIQNVTIRSVLLNQVTFMKPVCMCITIDTSFL